MKCYLDLYVLLHWLTRVLYVHEVSGKCWIQLSRFTWKPHRWFVGSCILWEASIVGDIGRFIGWVSTDTRSISTDVRGRAFPQVALAYLEWLENKSFSTHLGQTVFSHRTKASTLPVFANFFVCFAPSFPTSQMCAFNNSRISANELQKRDFFSVFVMQRNKGTSLLSVKVPWKEYLPSNLIIFFVILRY